MSGKYLALVFTSLLTMASATYAADLVDIFRSSRDHDPQWASEKAKFKSQKQLLPAAEALLYPKISTSATTQSIKTSGSGIAIINPVYLDSTALTDCIIDVQVQNRECDPPLVIRDDLGGRYDTYTFSLVLSQPLYNYKLWQQYNQAKAHISMSIAKHEQSKQLFLLKVAKSYFEVLRAYESWEHAASEENASKTELAQTKKRFQLGITPQIDVYKLRATHDSKKVELLSAQSKLENAQEDLMLMTQRRDIAIATLSDNLVIEPPQPSNVEDWVKMGLEHNRALQVAHAMTLKAQDELKMEKGGFHPTIDLIAGQTISKNDNVAFESAPSVTKTGIGLQINYPIYQGGFTTAKVKFAHHKYNSTLDTYELTRRGVIRNVRNNYRKVHSSVKRVEAAAQAIHSSQKSLEASRAAYKDGLTPLVSVLKSQNDLFIAKKAHANARYDFIASSLSLKYEAGTLAVEDIQVINSWLNIDKLILPPDLMSGQSTNQDLFY